MNVVLPKYSNGLFSRSLKKVCVGWVGLDRESALGCGSRPGTTGRTSFPAWATVGTGSQAQRDAHAGLVSSLGRRMRLQAAAARVKDQRVRLTPWSFVRVWPAVVLIQPIASSIRFRARWLWA